MKSKAIAMFALVGMLAMAQGLLAADQAEKKKQRGPGGKVKSIDASTGTLVVATRGATKGESVDKTYKIAKDCKVTIEKDAKTLADVKEGMIVRLTVGANDEVTAIATFTRKKKEKT